MQVINTTEHSKYFCPYKITKGDYNRCEGPKCMLWTYKLIPIDQSTTLSLVEDKTRGYCGV
jgi:hypothetical protein